MSLYSAHQDILAEIISYLDRGEVHGLAKIFNQRILSVCRPLIRKERSHHIIANKDRMLGVFGQCLHESSEVAKRFTATVGEHHSVHKSRYPNNAHRLKWDNAVSSRIPVYLNTIPSPSWLMPLGPQMITKVVSSDRWSLSANVVAPNEMKRFGAQVDELRLTLPRSFYYFMTDSTLRQRYPLSKPSRFLSELQLTRVVSASIEDMDGYVCMFYADER